MAPAVALVQTYLRANGYFTVAEFPVVEADAPGSLRAAMDAAMDVDILAFRFPRPPLLAPGAGRTVRRDPDTWDVDLALGIPADEADMIIAEVTEGAATLTGAAADPAVLRSVLARFGCCSPGDAPRTVERLLRKGHLVLESGHHLRLLAFGSVIPPSAERLVSPYRCVPLGHVIAYLERHVRDHWAVLRAGGTRDPVLGALILRETVRRAADERASAAADAPAAGPAPHDLRAGGRPQGAPA